MKLKARWKLILIISILALVVSAFSITVSVLVNKKQKNPEVQQTGAASATSISMIAEGADGKVVYESNDSFTISNVSELNHFAKLVDTAYEWNLIGVGKSWYTFEGKTVLLTADISPVGGFSPIGYKNSDNNGYFKGTFDGQGHTLSSISISEDDYYESKDKAADNMGLFKILGAGAAVKNLRLRNLTVSTFENNPTLSDPGSGFIISKYNVGGIAGYAESGVTISNCAVDNFEFNYNHVCSLFNAEMGYTNFGGIVGNGRSATTSDCLVQDIDIDITNTYSWAKQYTGTKYVNNVILAIDGNNGGSSTVVSGSFTVEDTESGKVFLQQFLTDEIIQESNITNENTADPNGNEIRYSIWASSNAAYNCVNSKPTSFPNLDCDSVMESTWYYGGTEWNGGAPYLTQFLDSQNLTVKLNESYDGATIEESTSGLNGTEIKVKIPTNDVSLNKSTKITGNPLKILALQFLANNSYTYYFSYWQWAGNNTYIAHYSDSYININFEQAKLVYKKWDLKTETWVDDTSKTTNNNYGTVSPTTYKTGKGSLLTVEAILEGDSANGIYKKLIYNVNGNSITYSFPNNIFGVDDYYLQDGNKSLNKISDEYYVNFKEFVEEENGDVTITIKPTVYIRQIAVNLNFDNSWFNYVNWSGTMNTPTVYLDAEQEIKFWRDEVRSTVYIDLDNDGELEYNLGLNSGIVGVLYVENQSGLLYETINEFIDDEDGVINLNADCSLYASIERDRKLTFKNVPNASLTMQMYDKEGNHVKDKELTDDYSVWVKPLIDIDVNWAGSISGTSYYSSITYDPKTTTLDSDDNENYLVKFKYTVNSSGYYISDDGLEGYTIKSDLEIAPVVEKFRMVTITFADAVDTEGNVLYEMNESIEVHVGFSEISVWGYKDEDDGRWYCYLFVYDSIVSQERIEYLVYPKVDLKYYLSYYSAGGYRYAEGDVKGEDNKHQTISVDDDMEFYPVFALKTYNGNFEGEKE